MLSAVALRHSAVALRHSAVALDSGLAKFIAMF